MESDQVNCVSNPASEYSLRSIVDTLVSTKKVNLSKLKLNYPWMVANLPHVSKFLNNHACLSYCFQLASIASK